MGRSLLIYSENHLSSLGGIERWILEVASEMRNKYNWRVVILTTNIGFSSENLTQVTNSLELHGIEYVSTEVSLLKPFYLMPSNLQMLMDYIRDCDVVYYADGVPRPLSEFFLKLMAILNNKPLIQGFHLPFQNCKPDIANLKFVNLINKIKMINPLERRTYYHTINRDDFFYLKNRGFKVFYVPNWVDTKYFTPSDKKFNEFTVLFIGKARIQKGIDFIPKIVRRINLNKTRLEFILVTDATILRQLEPELEKICKKFAKRIKFVQMPSDRYLLMLYRRSHVLLFPSRYEGFGNVILEAHSCGLPVIAFNIPDAPRDVIVNGVTGSLVPPYEIEYMAREILHYYHLWKTNYSVYRHICLKARKRALMFDRSKILPKLAHSIETVNIRGDSGRL